jgi:single-strand DNA-binding protein
MTITNKVEMIGEMSGEINTQIYANGKKMVSFRVVTRDIFYGVQAEKEDNNNFHNIQAFGKIADICEKYFKEGNKCAIQGKIVTIASDHVIQINEILFLTL